MPARALFPADARTPFYPAYGEGEAEAEALADEMLAAEALAEEMLAEDALAEETLAADVLAGETLAGGTPVGPALMVRTTGALGRASVPAEGSVSVTVPYSSGPSTDLMAATV